MFEIKHGIVVANSRLEHTLSVIDRRGHHHFDARRVEEPRFRAAGMEWAAMGATAGRATNDYRHRHTGPPVHLARHIDDLDEAGGNKIDKLHLGNPPHTPNSPTPPNTVTDTCPHT